MPGEGKPGSREAAGYIQYEIDMLRFTFQELLEYQKPGKLTDTQKMFHNVVLESFLLHVRNLRQFLTNLKLKTDDIIANEFIEDENIGTDFSYLVRQKIDDDEIKRIHKMLAHISYKRRDLPKSWPTGKYYQGLMIALKGFRDSLDNEKKAWFWREDLEGDSRGPEIVDGTWSTYSVERRRVN